MSTVFDRFVPALLRAQYLDRLLILLRCERHDLDPLVHSARYVKARIADRDAGVGYPDEVLEEYGRHLVATWRPRPK